MTAMKRVADAQESLRVQLQATNATLKTPAKSLWTQAKKLPGIEK